MIARGRGGAIVNTASMAGKRGDAPYLSHYVASKFGVVGLTQAMAAELAPHRIRVNCVCPGYVATAMQERELVWEAELRGTTPRAPCASCGSPTRRSAAWRRPTTSRARWPSWPSDDAGFVTGEALAVNGGAFMD